MSLREDFGWLNSDQLHGLCSWQSEGRVGEIHLLAVVLFHVLGFTVRLLLCLKKIYIYTLNGTYIHTYIHTFKIIHIIYVNTSYIFIYSCLHVSLCKDTCLIWCIIFHDEK